MVERTGRIACFEPCVPDRAVEILGDVVGASARRGVVLLGEQGEKVDVRARRELASAVPAGRYQRKRNRARARKPGSDRGEQVADHLVGERGDGAHHLLPAGPGAVARQDLLAALRQPGLYLSHRGVVRHPRTIARRRANRIKRQVCRAATARAAADRPAAASAGEAPCAAVPRAADPCASARAAADPSPEAVSDRSRARPETSRPRAYGASASRLDRSFRVDSRTLRTFSISARSVSEG